ncbi:nascent polypeptide-associated complex subunit alpha, muscle-specific form isoform X2 [Hyalella azteca]|uniref:Nascent polypeptide-associated complex subunit alpha, muscle-specific form isoform X2 n=1 Tax=Hyalella azteca TaxID=294128 RepID=A0A8B7PAV8_HYAAZ|nr:nascent polypeptide-associated complex subunit alpha, muscle-specific form isoform X2 [Hyalella azteca]
MDSSLGNLQPVRRAPPPPRQLPPVKLTAAGDKTTHTKSSKPEAPSPTPRSKPLTMSFIRRNTRGGHVNGNKKEPPPRPPPPKLGIHCNRLQNNVPECTENGEAILIDLSPSPSKNIVPPSKPSNQHNGHGSTRPMNSNHTKPKLTEPVSLLDAPLSSFAQDFHTNGFANNQEVDPFGSIEEDNLPLNNFGPKPPVSVFPEPPSRNYNGLKSEFESTTIDWNACKNPSVIPANDPYSPVSQSRFYSDTIAPTVKDSVRSGVSQPETGVQNTAPTVVKKKPTIIKPKNTTVMCVAPNPVSSVTSLHVDETTQQRSTTDSTIYAVAEFDYESAEPGDLCLKEGDVIEGVSVVNNEWLEGTLHGRRGIFPASFVKVTTGVEQTYPDVSRDFAAAGSSCQTYALYDFSPELPSDLPLKEGAVVTVTAVVEGGQWLLGESEGRSGQFPANFVAHVPNDLPVVTL